MEDDENHGLFHAWFIRCVSCVKCLIRAKCDNVPCDIKYIAVVEMGLVRAKCDNMPCDI